MMLVVTVPVYEEYVSLLPECARKYLKEQLDWDNKGVDHDLNDIADKMHDWEEKLSAKLELTPIEIGDLKTDNNISILLRYI